MMSGAAFRQGELGKTFFVILRGSASVELPSIGLDGRTVQIASVGKSLIGYLALIEARLAIWSMHCAPPMRQYGRWSAERPQVTTNHPLQAARR
jgi:hypothetical protein